MNTLFWLFDRPGLKRQRVFAMIAGTGDELCQYATALLSSGQAVARGYHG